MARAAGTTAGKGNYQAPAKPRKSQSVVPKSIYATPKSDRLKNTKSGQVEEVSRKANRRHISPTDDEPWVEEPDEDATEPEAQAANDPLPEITIPFDPHVRAPAKAKSARPSKKSKRRKVRRPIDVAMHNGRLKLNKFRTLSMDMPHSECRKFSDFFVADYDLPSGAVDVLADNMLIVQKRICADNGAVMVTCYQNNATISMRRSRPDDGCKR